MKKNTCHDYFHETTYKTLHLHHKKVGLPSGNTAKF